MQPGDTFNVNQLLSLQVENNILCFTEEKLCITGLEWHENEWNLHCVWTNLFMLILLKFILLPRRGANVCATLFLVYIL